jgi:hypothetical protein
LPAPKKQEAKHHESSRMLGGKKSSRWSAQTRANKARRASIRENRLLRAAERRASLDVVNPATGLRLTGEALRKALLKREDQARRISAKMKSRHQQQKARNS